MKRMIGLCTGLLLSFAMPLWAELREPGPMTAKEIRAEVGKANAQRAAAFSLDAFAGWYPRHSELHLGAALVVEDGQRLRLELQLAENNVGLGIGYKLPLKLLADALAISIGAGVSWDTARQEWQGSVYLAHVVF